MYVKHINENNIDMFIDMEISEKMGSFCYNKTDYFSIKIN